MNKTKPFLHIILLITDPLQEQIHFNGNVSTNCYRCNEGSLYQPTAKILKLISLVSNFATFFCHGHLFLVHVKQIFVPRTTRIVNSWHKKINVTPRKHTFIILTPLNPTFI